ncbi:PAS domain-containing protein [Sphingomonas metalli]|uniref:PAS domain-containing protein n=1 Tax=Sphingomonas metalli TaxID=1779358 RepID=UPI001667D4F0|nr:PAS domain-containing protein [Sphingomonas metalli]
MKLIGIQGEILYVNPAGLQMLEVESFEQVAGLRWDALLPTNTSRLVALAYGKAAGGETSRFRAFCPTRAGLPRWCDVTVSPISDDGGELQGYLCVSRDVTESHAAREALEISSAEIKHRLKNTYTMVGGLLNAFARGNKGTEAFAAAMTERLASLSTAQSLFLSDEAHCQISHLIPVLLAPFDNPGCPVFVDEQSPAIVDQGVADAIALVLGELSVNSAKHGALNHGGEIHVSSIADKGILTVRWKERALRAIRQRSRQGGQGLTLMSRIVRTRGGAIALEWHDDGLDVTMTLPFEESGAARPAAQ